MTSTPDVFGPPPPAGEPDSGLLESALEGGRLSFQKLLVPASITPKDNLNNLLNQFDDRTLNAFITLFYDLDQLCFRQRQSIIEEDGTVRSNQAIDYLTGKLVIELYSFIDLIFAASPKDLPGRDRIVSFFELWLEKAERQLAPSNSLLRVGETTSELTALQVWHAKIKEVQKNFDAALKAGAAADAAQEALDETIEARDATIRAAGQTGAASLGNHFGEVATNEGWKAAGWTLTSFGCIVAVLRVSGLIVYHTVNSDWVPAALHLVVVLPIVGAATYASKLARHHRIVGRWAKTAKVQINTVEAFSKQLNEAKNRDELILALGKTVFSPPHYGDDLKGEQFSSLPPDVMEALKVIAQKLPGGNR